MKKVLTKINKLKPTPDQAFEGLKIFFEVVKENYKITQEETTKRESIKAQKEIKLEQIRTQREILENYFEKVFAERKEIFKKEFEILDKGLETNNLELIQISLSSIIDLAKESPLAQVKKTLDDFYNDDVNMIEI